MLISLIKESFIRRVMLRITVAVIISVFTLYSNLNSGLRIIPDSKGISITVSNLQLQTSQARFEITGREFSSYLGKYAEFGETSLPTLEFEFSVDDPVKIKVTSQVSHWNKLSSFKSRLDEHQQLPQLISTYNKGKISGVSIINFRITPFEYDPASALLRYAQDLTVRIDFAGEVPMGINSKAPGENFLFKFVDNPEHLTYLLDNKKNKSYNTKSKILSGDWYSPLKEYYRISTTRDGIAKINISELIKIAPKLKGLENDYLHLLYNGLEQPFYYSGKNSLINTGDYIIFPGKRPAGDTTWFDNYTDRAVFFMYYDESSKGSRIKKGSYNPDFPLYQGSVDINQHIEEEKDYWVGIEIADFDTSPTEGWYWKVLKQIKEENFKQKLYLLPADETNQNLNIRLHLATVDSAWYEPTREYKTPDYHLQFLMNNDTIKDETFKKRRYVDYTTEKLGNNLIYGMNELSLTSFVTDTFRLGLTLIDYISITGNSLPFALNGRSAFEFESQSSNNIAVPGFSNEEIYSIDTVDNLLQKLPIIKGYQLSAGTYKGSSLYATISINDTTYYNYFQGIHIGWINPRDNKIQFVYSGLDFNIAYNVLDTIPSGSIILLLYNSDVPLPDYIKTQITNLGSTSIKSFDPANVYSLVAEKGFKLIKEKISLGKSSIALFYELEGGNFYKGILSVSSPGRHKLVISEATALEEAIVEPVSSSDLRNTSNSADYIIISHKNFLPEAVRLATHREKFNNVQANVIDIDNIYKEFASGRKSPHALKAFLNYAYNNWQKKPGNVLLFGDASWDTRRILPNAKSIDYIPTYGYPVTDYWYGLFDDDLMPELIIGRLPVSSLAQAGKVVDKLILYDTLAPKPWMKSFLWLSGGLTDNERKNFFERRLPFFFDLVNGPQICGDTSSIRKKDPTTGGEKESSEIKGKINEGVGWTTFAGHAAAEIFDMDGWQSEKLNNYGRYGFFTTLSCNSGDFGNPFTVSRNESYVIEPDKGFVASAGATATSNINQDCYILMKMASAMADNNIRNLGDLVYLGKTKNYNGDFWEKLSLFAFCLIGDPLTQLKIDVQPDLYLVKDDISIESSAGGTILDENADYAHIFGYIYNAGLWQNRKVKLMLSRNYEGNEYMDFVELPSLCNREFFEFKLPVKNLPGLHKVKLIIDPYEETVDSRRENNTVEFVLNVFNSGLLALDPLPLWNKEVSNPKFRFINPARTTDEFVYEFAISKDADTSQQPIKVSDQSEIEDTEAYIDWNPAIILNSNQSYWLRARLKSVTSGKYSSWLSFPFNSLDSEIDEQVSWSIRSRNEFEVYSSNNLSMSGEPDNPKLEVFTNKIPFYILGVTGGPPLENVIRFCRITIDTTDYVNQEFSRGLNILGYDMYTGKGRFRQFDTWENPEACSDFVRYLTDSIRNEEYVLVATNDRALFTPYSLAKDHPGYIDSIKIALSRFGAGRLDNLNDSASFAFFGWRGADTSQTIVSVNEFKDSAIVNSTLTVYEKEGYLESNFFGPAKRWKNLKVIGNLDNSGFNYKVTIFGRNRDGNITELLTFNDKDSIDLGSINAFEFPYIRFRIDLSIPDRNTRGSISEIMCLFSPAPEFAYIDSKSNINLPAPMRGDKANITVAVRNISLRSASDREIPLDITTTTLQGDPEEAWSANIKLLEPGEISILPFELTTRKLQNSNNINIAIDNQGLLNELFTFNNTAKSKLDIYEDREQPVIALFADDVQVVNYQYVPIQPEFRITVDDNSPLDMDSTMLRAKINGKFVDAANTLYYNFKTSKDSVPGRKLELIFRKKDSLEITAFTDSPTPKGNLISVYAVDASGNRDTLELYINVSLNGLIEANIVYPNPLVNSTEFEFDFKAPEKKGTAIVEIFNDIGQKVADFSFQLKLGKNNSHWQAIDSAGRSLPVGMYYYRIRIEGELYVEPVTGILSIGN